MTTEQLQDQLGPETKYSRWYLNIIENAKLQSRVKNGLNYYERHHILPSSLFPDYKNLNVNDWNAVLLTAREHYICHVLIWKHYKKLGMKTEAWKMMNAVRLLSGPNKYNSHLYEQVKLEYIEGAKKRKTFISESNNKSFWCTPEEAELLKAEYPDIKVGQLESTRKKNGDSNRGKIYCYDEINKKAYRLTEEDFENHPDRDKLKIGAPPWAKKKLSAKIYYYHPHAKKIVKLNEEEFNNHPDKNILVKGRTDKYSSKGKLKYHYKDTGKIIILSEEDYENHIDKENLIRGTGQNLVQSINILTKERKRISKDEYDNDILLCNIRTEFLYKITFNGKIYVLTRKNVINNFCYNEFGVKHTFIANNADKGPLKFKKRNQHVNGMIIESFNLDDIDEKWVEENKRYIILK